MNLLHFYSIALATILLSIPLNAMEEQHSLKGTELLLRITNNNTLELATNTKDNIARYCFDRIRHGIEATQQEIETNYKLSSSFMYKFLNHDSHVSNIENILKNDTSLNTHLALSFKKGLQNINTCPDIRLFYCFPKMVEILYCEILGKKMGCSAAQVQKMTKNELLEKDSELNQDTLAITKLNISIDLAESILLFLEEDVNLAKNILLLRDNKINEEQLENLNKDLNQITFVDLVDTIFNRVYKDYLDSEKTITQQSQDAEKTTTQQSQNKGSSCSII